MFSSKRTSYWKWQGIDPAGLHHRGIIAATNRQQANSYLHSHDITPVALRRFWTIGTPCCSATALTEWLMHLQQLLTVGISLPQALQVMEQAAATPCAMLLTQQVRHTLNQGHSLSTILEHTPYAHLPPIELGLLATAEQQSALQQGLSHLTQRRRHQHQWQQRCRQQLRYPLILVTAGLGMMALMMKMVVPRFTQLYQQSGHPLPMLTQGLVRLTHALTYSVWPYAAIGILLLLGWHYRHHPYATKIAAHLPIVATLHRHQLGIVLLEQFALKRHMITAHAPTITPSSHHPTDRMMQQLQQALAGGAPLSHVMSSCHSGSRPLFAKDIIHLLRIAEQTGQMDDVLKQASQLLEQRSEHYRLTLTAWLEPLLLSCLGIVIGTLMLSLYLPILDMKDVMI